MEKSITSILHKTITVSLSCFADFLLFNFEGTICVLLFTSLASLPLPSEPSRWSVFTPTFTCPGLFLANLHTDSTVALVQAVASLPK